MYKISRSRIDKTKEKYAPKAKPKPKFNSKPDFQVNVNGIFRNLTGRGIAKICRFEVFGDVRFEPTLTLGWLGYIDDKKLPNQLCIYPENPIGIEFLMQVDTGKVACKLYLEESEGICWTLQEKTRKIPESPKPNPKPFFKIWQSQSQKFKEVEVTESESQFKWIDMTETSETGDLITRAKLLRVIGTPEDIEHSGRLVGELEILSKDQKAIITLDEELEEGVALAASLWAVGKLSEKEIIFDNLRNEILRLETELQERLRIDTAKYEKERLWRSVMAQRLEEARRDAELQRRMEKIVEENDEPCR